jgi:hypothetical protein
MLDSGVYAVLPFRLAGCRVSGSAWCGHHERFVLGSAKPLLAKLNDGVSECEERGGRDVREDAEIRQLGRNGATFERSQGAGGRCYLLEVLVSMRLQRPDRGIRLSGLKSELTYKGVLGDRLTCG